MKKFCKIIFLPVLALVFSTCNLLDGPKPQGALTFDELNNIDNYQTFLNGVYNGPQNLAPQIVYMHDSMTEFVRWNLSFVDYADIAGAAMSANNGTVTSLWNQMYSSINSANIIIEDIAGLDSGTPGEKDDILGQALFLRAYMYYVLVQYYSKPWGATSDNSHLGVPLRLAAVRNTGDFNDTLARATVKEVYTQIDADLQEAQGKITNTHSGLATDGAVTALRARIALIQERWGDAASLAETVLNNSKYRLSSDVTEYFRNEFGSESIFEIVNTPSDNPGGGNTSISTVYNIDTRPGGYPSNDYMAVVDQVITPSQENALSSQNSEAVDTRTTELLIYDNSPTPVLFTHKFEDALTAADNVPILRLSEMYLTRAEALTRDTETVNQDAIDLLNKIRERSIRVIDANGDPGDIELIKFEQSDFADYEELLEAIYTERTVELSFEGFFLGDKQRYHKNVRGAISWDANRLVFPIPQSQMDVTGDIIEQNDGYTN